MVKEFQAEILFVKKVFCFLHKALRFVCQAFHFVKIVQ